jgi:hypothetical protein
MKDFIIDESKKVNARLIKFGLENEGKLNLKFDKKDTDGLESNFAISINNLYLERIMETTELFFNMSSKKFVEKEILKKVKI